MDTTTNHYRRHQTILQIGELDRVFAEIRHILTLISPTFQSPLLAEATEDLVKLFRGEFPGYGASNTKYHNLAHTAAVALASVRLAHGLHCQGTVFSEQGLELLVLSAYFHDTGLLPDQNDQVGTGAKHMLGHEQRSSALLGSYLTAKGRPAAEVETCRQIIDCTILAVSPTTLTFTSEEVHMLGRIVGSADLLAQLADRYYLEKIPHLFQEFKEGGVAGYNSSLELLKKTGEFYTNVARKRLDEDLGGIAAAMRFHFHVRWQVEADLYAEAINNHLLYLRMITESCANSYPCLLANLRRRG